MYKIVIADDEVHIRELIAMCINQSDLGAVVVGSAENGEEAFDLIEQHQPDILITDVCMPNTDGLDLIARIRKNPSYQGLKTIIISGYDDFVYVQKAVKLGVSNYLLKPFSPEELLQNLDSLKKEIERRDLVLQNMSALEARFENNISLLQEVFLKQVIMGEVEPGILEKRAHELKINLNCNQYFIGLIKINGGYFGANLSGEEKKMLEEILLLVRERYFHECLTTYGIRLENNVIAILFGSVRKNQETCLTYVKEGVTKLNESLKRYYQVSMNCAIGHGYGTIQEAKQSYEEAKYALKANIDATKYFIQPANARLNPPSNPVLSRSSKKLREELVLQVRMANKEKAIEIFHQMLSEYEKPPAHMVESMDMFLLELLFLLEDTLRNAGNSDGVIRDMELHDCVKQQLLYGGMWEINQFIENAIEKACDCFCERNENGGEKLVHQMKQLIEHNLSNEQFTLEMIASELFFSSNYLRKLFKRIVGVGFSDYLIMQRMETAKERLKDSSKKILDVAEECGYSNQRYFASAFKKYYGNTPTEYREKMEGVENET